MTYWKLMLLAAGFSLALGACSPIATPQAPTQEMVTAAAPTATTGLPTPTTAATQTAIPTAAATQTANSTASPAAVPTATGEVSSTDVAQLAVNEAVRILGAPAEQVSVLGIERVEWPSPAMGCPLPGLQYSEATRPGYRVRLEVAGIPLEFHTDDTGRSVLCDLDGEPVLPKLKITPGTINDSIPWPPVN